MADLDWVTLTKRTNDPKLAWIENQLTMVGISHRRNGESFHAPILEVREHNLTVASEILFMETGHGTVDDMADDHLFFRGE